MIDSFYLAWRYLRYHRLRTVLLVASLSLIGFVPAALDQLLDESQRQLMARADSTPLIIGARGSRMDLVMNALYFSNDSPAPLAAAAVGRVMDSGLADAVPLYVRFKTRHAPIVGTTLDYFDFRGLAIHEGRQLGMLGECVVGAALARKYNLKPGDHLISAPQDLFDMAGVYPLRMKVVGVLEENGSPDDEAVFVDIQTTWVIDGLGHGHQDVSAIDNPSLLLESADTSIRTSEKLDYYNEITEQNIDSFHFHGDPNTFPLTAVIVLPHDDKSAALLKGRYLAVEDEQMITTPEVINELLQNIFRIKRLMDAIILVVAVAMGLSVILVFLLSLRLRAREIETVFNLGGSRSMVVQLVTAEILLIALLTAAVCTLLLGWLGGQSSELVRYLLIQ